jgi:hypothetical protein
MSLKRLAPPILAFLALALVVPAGEAPGEFSLGPERERLARSLYSHDFENRRDPDTGDVLAESAVLNGFGWRDFWEPVLAVDYPEYLLETVGVLPDGAAQIPGAYRDEDNHVLRIGFDGTRVGLKTRFPVPVDPSLAYEFSLLHRDQGLRGAEIRAGVEWLRVEPTSVRSLRSDAIPDLAPGQEDWPVESSRMRINDPPPEANAARLFITVNRLPGAIGGDYQGELRVDNLGLRPFPRISVDPIRLRSGGGGGSLVPVRYSGLFDNIPDPANPGYFKGKRYSRRVEATDILNRPIRLRGGERSAVQADASGSALEEIAVPDDRFGVYYLNIRLYDAEEKLVVDVMRSVAMMRPVRRDDGLTIRSLHPSFGVRVGLAPDGALADPGLLRRLAEGMGARTAKIVPWRDSYLKAGENEDYYRLLAESIRSLRSAGVTVIGDIRPPSGMFGQATMAEIMNGSAERLAGILGEAGRNIGLFVDGWQWGDDSDLSLLGAPAGEGSASLAAALADFAKGLPAALNRGAGNDSFPWRPEITGLFVPVATDANGVWEYAARVFPWLYERFQQERGAIYPPARLSRLAPAPVGDELEERERRSRRSGSWITLESTPTWSHEPNAGTEKTQLEQVMLRAVRTAALAPDTIFLGELFEPSRGLVRQDASGGYRLETVARPVYLAAGVLSELLEGSEYLGQLGLLNPYEAHVFRRPGTDDSVIVVWHNDSIEERRLPRAEIADGPPLTLIDWAGNRDSLPASIPVRRVPSFITGLPASLALTRMSVRVAPDPPVFSIARRQNQTLEVVNHMRGQAPVVFRLSYAARLTDGGMENNWTVTPREMRLNLPPLTPQFPAGMAKYTVSPDPNSPAQAAGPGSVDKYGFKLAKVNMTLNTSQPADMTLYLPFRLHSDLDVDIAELPRINDPNFVTLQLRLRWFPAESGRRGREIRMVPFHIKKGRMKEPLPFPVTLKAMPAEERGNPESMYETVELRIPRRPLAQTWVGLDEDGGSAFYMAEVTDFLRQPAEP